MMAYLRRVELQRGELEHGPVAYLAYLPTGSYYDIG